MDSAKGNAKEHYPGLKTVQDSTQAGSILQQS